MTGTGTPLAIGLSEHVTRSERYGARLRLEPAAEQVQVIAATPARRSQHSNISVRFHSYRDAMSIEPPPRPSGKPKGPSSQHSKELRWPYFVFYFCAALNCVSFIFASQGSASRAIVASIGVGVSTVAVIVVAAVTVTTPGRPAQTVGIIVTGVVLIVIDFSLIYWSFGSTVNFSSKLSKMDAFYFTLGTFTTAGTGSLSPISEFARILVSCQYIIDVIFVGWIIAMGVSRLSANK